MTSVLVPIFICVVLPVSVVLIRAIMNMHTENKRSEVLLKAIETTNSRATTATTPTNWRRRSRNPV